MVKVDEVVYEAARKRFFRDLREMEAATGRQRPTAVAVLDASLAVALTDGSIALGSVHAAAPHLLSRSQHVSVPAGCLKWADTGLLAVAVMLVVHVHVINGSFDFWRQVVEIQPCD